MVVVDYPCLWLKADKTRIQVTVTTWIFDTPLCVLARVSHAPSRRTQGKLKVCGPAIC